MDALVMCGGRGTRFDGPVEKPVFDIEGRPMVDWVLAALEESSIDRSIAVVSPNAPATRRHVAALPTIETPGAGYVADLDRALEHVDQPVMTVAADLPLLDGQIVDELLATYDTGSLTVCVPAERKRRLGVSVEGTRGDRELVPAGINIVGDGDETVVVIDDRRLAVNVNRRADALVAEALR